MIIVIYLLLYSMIEFHVEFEAFDFDFCLKPVSGDREQFDSEVNVQESPLGGGTASMLDLWRRLASCVVRLDQLRQISFKFENTYFARETMKAIRPAMQDMYVSLGHRLVVSPSSPPNMFIDPEEYPYLDRMYALSFDFVHRNF